MNGKRILAAVLAAAMTASSFTIDAFADNITPQNNVTDNSTENTVTAYTTNDEADDSVLAGTTVINCASLDELQSEHPYAENSDITYVYTDTSCNNLKITFSVDSSFEFIKDFLTIYDGDDNQIDKLGGTDLAGITVYVPGNTVKLRLTSDDSTCYYGFKVFSVENVDIMPTQGDPEYDYILKNISADDEAPVYYINKYKGAGGDIVIPSEIDGRKVSGISNGAFNGCTTATNVAVSDGISNIDFNAFSNCPALKSVSLPKGVTTINSGAFYDCKNLTDITLPDGLAIIETLTFYGCSSLADITIPDSVTEIGYQAFFNCTSLKTVTVPESVSTIDKYAFGYYYDSETNEQKKIDGFKINYTKNTAGHLYAFENGFTDESCLVSQLQDDGTVQITQYLGSDTSFAIPDEINGKKVTGIGKMAFQNCTSLTSITIPDSVTDIESYAFDGCTALTDIVLPDNVTSVGENAFYNCTSLKTATVPASVTSIGDYAFGYYNDGTGTKKIDGFKINYIKNTQGHIYAAINGFTDEACLFTELQDDGTVKISKYIGNDTVYVIPDEIDGKKVTSIGSEAFQKCTSLTSITIPDSVTDIEQYAFEGCSSLSDITLPDNLTSIGLNAFASCTTLTDIALPDSLTYIDGFAFINCTSLKTVTVPASVTFIGGYAFGFYYKDGDIDARVAFDDFTINYTKHTAGHLYAIENGFTDEGCLKYTVSADGTLEISGYVGNDTILEIPAEIGGKKVTRIGYKAFENCASLTSVTIPDSVTDIGFQAFHNCTSLKSVTIPASVTTIDNYAFGYFYDANKETKIDGFTINYTKNTAGHLYAAQNGFTDEACLINELQDDGTVIITKYAGNDTVYEIPSEIDGKKVTGIGNRAFQNCTSLTSVTIPSGVTYIDECAFQGCSSLTDIALPDSLTIINASAFYSCVMLTSIAIPNGVTRIEWMAFYGCSSLTDLVLPDSVTDVGYKAFFDCPSLKTVTIPASVTDIGKYAFGYHDDDNWNPAKIDGFKINYTKNTWGHYYAKQNGFSDEPCLVVELNEDGTTLKISKYDGNDTEYVIPEEIDGKKITEIGYNAFENCTSLTSVTIPDGVTMIGSAAFRGCTALTDVVLPDSVMDISTYAFMDCTSLKSVTIPASVRNIGNNAFGYYNDNGAEKKIDGFKINYAKNTCGHYYATENGFTDEPCLVADLKEDGTLQISKYVGNDTALVIPAEINGKKVTSIGNGAFNGNKLLTSVTIPDGVTIIGAQAFNGCTALTDINIPDGVTRIGSYAFNECSALADIKIPDSVTAIGMGAFNDTAILNNQDPTAKYVGKWLVYYDKTKTSASIKADTVGIADIAFYGCKIENIVIPDKVKYIGNNAFSSCSWLESVVIPDSVITIGEAAFLSCDSLASVSIPASVVSIEKMAFGFSKYNQKYDDFKIEYVKQTEGHRYAAENGFTDEIFFLTEKLDNGSLRVIGYAGKASSVTIPAEINGKSVTELGDEEYRFRYSGTLKSLTVPDSVIKINYKAFISGKLTTVVLPEKLTDIGIGAFAVTPVIKKQKTDIKYIGSTVISCDTEAETLTIGDNVTTIASNAFVNGDGIIDINGASKCGDLKSLIISRNVKYIGEHAFGYYLDEDNNYRKVEDFAIKCYCNSAAEQYAKDNGIEYELIADGHNAVVDKAVEPTCTKTGLTEGSHCSICGATLIAQKTIPATGHTEVTDKAVAATCTKTGLTEGKHCSVCNTVLKAQETIPATGKHDFGDWKTTKAATYTATGTKTKTCKVCKKTETATIAKLTLAKVSGFKVKTKDSASVTLQWNKNSSASGYIIEAYNGKTWSQVTKIAKNSTLTYKVTKLSASKTYQYRIKAYKTEGKATAYSANSATLSVNTNPSNMSGFKVKAKSYNSITLQWNKNASATGYELQKWDGKKWVSLTKINKNSTTTYTVKSLKASTTYKYRIRAYKTIGKATQYSAYTTTLSVNTNPSNMSGFKAKSKSYNSITLQWNKNTSATGYELQKWDGKKWTTLTKISKNSTTTYTIRGLKASTTYKYRIRAYKTIGKVTQYSANSATLSVNTNPSNMSGFKAKAKSYNSITLQWNKNASATGYELQKWDGKKWVSLTKINKNSTTTYTVKSLKASTTYKYRIRAYKTIGKTTQYSAYTATLSVNTNPSNMSGFKVKAKSYNSITLQWNKNTSATGYELQKWDGKKWVTLTKIAKNSTTTYTVKSLKASTTYKYRIRAYKTIGKATQYSAYSAILSVNTNPTNMSGFKVKAKSYNSITLQWNKNTSATGYELQKWDGKKWVTLTKISKNSTTTYTVKSLKASTTYKYRIRAYKTIGKATQYSGYTELSVNTNPSNMSGFKAKSTAKTSVTLQWNKNTSATGYEIQKWDGKKWVSAAKVTKNSTTTYTVKSLKASITYKFRIRAYKTIGKATQYSSWSGTLTVKTKK